LLSTAKDISSEIAPNPTCFASKNFFNAVSSAE
jgi:hypothetical protein